jgi:hypothetical protein
MKNKPGMMTLRPHMKGRRNVVSQVGIYASTLRRAENRTEMPSVSNSRQFTEYANRCIRVIACFLAHIPYGYDEVASHVRIY